MFRINTLTAASALPAPAETGDPGFFAYAPPGSGVPPTVVSADWCNGIQEELMAFLTLAGITPDPANHGQVLAAVQQLISAGGLTKAAVADILAGTDNAKYLTALGLKQAMAAQTLSDASTVAWNLALGFRAKVTLGGNRTLGIPTNLQEGATGSLQVFQDGTGSRLLSFAAGWDFKSAGVPTLSTGAGKRDKIYYEVIDAVTPIIEASFSKAA